ncbi:5-(carboxyamino)imidazole ribonucleotide synthase [Litorimonas sp. RW-G-Af-16]|uniref:5-(carboxyamino)imidazole ribonucleotide synthase n=1 Tax=Litorimonas sp. RW-G-Af-16 TaxID=3241168 RepID=UPI00390C83E7
MSREFEILPLGSTIGILGGGQLGRMLAMAAARLGLKTHIYSPNALCPAADVANYISVGEYEDTNAIIDFAKACDVITYEFENVPAVTAKTAASEAPLRPNARALDVAQDRLTEKSFLRAQAGVEVAGFEDIDNEFALKRALKRLGYPAVLKTRRFGYDGKGQIIIRKDSEVKAAWNSLGKQDLIVEAFIPFVREVSVIAARGMDGTCRAYPLTENTHQNHILHTSIAPAPRDNGKAQEIAFKILKKLDYIGVMGVEFFELQDGSLIVNEIAPRVHNSGHWTQDGGCVDQFEQHIRAVAGWPLGDTTPAHTVTMTNLIGDDILDWPKIAIEANARLHIYGKKDIRPGRKMGHVNRMTRN